MEPPAPDAEPAAVEEAPPAEVAAEPVMEAPVAEAVAEAVQAAVEAAPAGETVVVVETTVETEEPAAPEVPQPTEGAMLTEAPAPAAEQPSSDQVCSHDVFLSFQGAINFHLFALNLHAGQATFHKSWQGQASMGRVIYSMGSAMRLALIF